MAREPKIALAGRSGSGKTAVAEYLVDKYGYTRCSTGAACRSLCKEFFGTDAKAILNKVTDALRAVDKDVWLRAAFAYVQVGRPIVFDSMRFANDYAFLRGQGFVMWRIDAPLSIRLTRMENRGQLVTAEDDEHAAETELDGFAFDRSLDNSAEGLESLYIKVENGLR